MTYNFKIKDTPKCKKCGTSVGITYVEKTCIAHSDDSETLILCFDCLLDEIDRKDEKGE